MESARRMELNRRIAELDRRIAAELAASGVVRIRKPRPHFPLPSWLIGTGALGYVAWVLFVSGDGHGAFVFPAALFGIAVCVVALWQTVRWLSERKPGLPETGAEEPAEVAAMRAERDALNRERTSLRDG